METCRATDETFCMGGIYSTPASAAAFAATGMISLAPNVILLLMPNYAAGGGETPTWLALGLAMGAGALLADVFLHTLAESTDKQTGMYVMTGFTIFFAVDLFVRFVNDDSLQSHSYQTRRSTITGENGGHTKEQSSAHSKNRSIVLLNLAADALHNFTDGLAIGASYSIMDTSATSSATSSATAWSMLRSHTRGGFATLSIFFHEVPHELSKFRFCQIALNSYGSHFLMQFVVALSFNLFYYILPSLFL